MAATLSYACPACAGEIAITAGDAGRQHHCPQCGIGFTIAARPRADSQSGGTSGKPHDHSRRTPDLDAWHAGRPATPPPTPEAAPTPPCEEAASSAIIPQKPTDQSRAALFPTRPSATFPLRYWRWIFFYGIWAAPELVFAAITLLGMAARSGGFVCFGVALWLFIGVPWFILGGWIARWTVPFLMAALFRTARCPRCQETVDLISVWNCSCGYNDHRERHACLRWCPSCGSRTGHFNCPRCEATILL